ncbi:MAG: hypothetical protein K2W95_25540 [Candidatus Obscuribacterales bacterium]|nr:hypothetical protein [Candidatus Obscuribacterales bacterium]
MPWQEQMKAASWAFWRENDCGAMEVAYLAAIREANSLSDQSEALVEELTHLGQDVSDEAEYGGTSEYLPAAITLWQRTLAIAEKIYGPTDARCLNVREHLSHCLSLVEIGDTTAEELEPLEQEVLPQGFQRDEVARAVQGFLASQQAVDVPSLSESDRSDLVNVIVRLADQVNWRERFASAMKMHGITNEEVEEEIRKQRVS